MFLGKLRLHGLATLLLRHRLGRRILRLCFQLIAQRLQGPDLLGQPGEVAQPRLDGLLVRANGLIQLRRRFPHVGKLLLQIGELPLKLLRPRSVGLGKLRGAG